MVRLSCSVMDLPLNRDGCVYFPSGIRSIVRITGVDDYGQSFLSEWAPLKSIHRHSVKEAQLQIESAIFSESDLKALSLRSDDELESFFRAFPYPLSFILSLGVFQFQSRNERNPHEIIASALILPHHTISEVTHAVAQGYRCLKIKCGDDIDGDRHRLDLIRAAAGPAVDLRIDLNKKLSFHDAKDFLRALKDMKIQYVEEPTFAIEQLAELSQETGMAIALDESFDPEASLDVVTNHHADYLIIKASRWNNVYAVMNLCRNAQKRSITPIFSTCFESDFYASLMMKMIKRLGLFQHAHGVFVPIFGE